jgi:hypothetical protein
MSFLLPDLYNRFGRRQNGYTEASACRKKVLLLPDAAVIGWHHGGAFLAAKGGGEAGLVDDGSVGAEVVGGVGIGEDLLADGFGA